MDTARRYFEVIQEIDSVVCDLKFSRKNLSLSEQEILSEAQDRIACFRSLPRFDLRQLAILGITTRISDVILRHYISFIKSTLPDSGRRPGEQESKTFGPPPRPNMVQYMQSVPDDFESFN